MPRINADHWDRANCSSSGASIGEGFRSNVPCRHHTERRLSPARHSFPFLRQTSRRRTGSSVKPTCGSVSRLSRRKGTPSAARARHTRSVAKSSSPLRISTRTSRIMDSLLALLIFTRFDVVLLAHGDVRGIVAERTLRSHPYAAFEIVGRVMRPSGASVRARATHCCKKRMRIHSCASPTYSTNMESDLSLGKWSDAVGGAIGRRGPLNGLLALLVFTRLDVVLFACGHIRRVVA